MAIIGRHWQESVTFGDRPQIGLVQKRRRLQSVVGPLPTQMLLGETVKLALYRGDELLESLRAARVARAKDCRDVV